MRGFVVFVIACVLCVGHAAAAAKSAPGPGETVAMTIAYGKYDALASAANACCMETLLKRKTRSSPCKADCTYLVAVSDVSFPRSPSINGHDSLRPPSRTGDERLLRPPIR